MENLVIQYPMQMLLLWTLLNLLTCCLNLLTIRLYKDTANLDSRFQVKYRKYFLKFFLWLGFGICILAGHRQAMLAKGVTAYECFVWIGAFFFLVIGYLLSNVLLLLKYFIYRREMPKSATYSFETCMMMYSFEYLGYSALMLSGFLMTKNPFLLGGTIGLALGASLYLLELTRKKKYPEIENNQKNEVG